MIKPVLPILLLSALLVSGPVVAAEYSGRARVIDGDTISIRQQRIRLGAIDACERDQTGLKDGAMWKCGVVARSHLAKLIDGKHVRCIVFDTDQYERLVGQCFSQDVDVGLEMVKAGQAALLLQYLPSSHPIDLHEYHAAEDSARARRRGLWGSQVERPSSYRRDRRHN